MRRYRRGDEIRIPPTLTMEILVETVAKSFTLVSACTATTSPSCEEPTAAAGCSRLGEVCTLAALYGPCGASAIRQ